MKMFLGIIVVLGLIVLIGCSKKTSPEVVQAGQTYYFYPKANVYFDTTAGNYIFQGLDGSWETNAKLTAEKQSLLEKNIVINNPELPVWKNNDAHQLLYSTALYSTAADFKEEVKIEVKKKEAVTDEKADDKEKTGLGKFFDKIFKGKKEKQEEKETDKIEATKS